MLGNVGEAIVRVDTLTGCRLAERKRENQLTMKSDIVDAWECE